MHTTALCVQPALHPLCHDGMMAPPSPKHATSSTPFTKMAVCSSFYVILRPLRARQRAWLSMKASKVIECNVLRAHSLRAAAHSVRFEASHVRWPLQLCTVRLTSRPSARILACCAHAVASSLNDFEFVQTGRPAVQLLTEISTTNSRLAMLESQVGEPSRMHACWEDTMIPHHHWRSRLNAPDKAWTVTHEAGCDLAVLPAAASHGRVQKQPPFTGVGAAATAVAAVAAAAIAADHCCGHRCCTAAAAACYCCCRRVLCLLRAPS
jgi:hypothetical protein